jgi:hypothetical protein
VGNLSAWFDWNIDGDWSDAGERAIADEPLTAGVNRVFFVVPVGAATGGTFARFRLSEQVGLSFAGPGGAGEVEDYRIAVAADGGATSVFTNPENAEDVSADGAVTLNDALVLINDLRANGVRQLSVTEFTPPPFLDPSGDGFITLNDVLQVINQLLIQNSQEGEAEGEISDAAPLVVLDSTNRRGQDTSTEDEPILPQADQKPHLPAQGASGNRLRAAGASDSPMLAVHEKLDEAVDAIAGDVCLAWSESAAG